MFPFSFLSSFVLLADQWEGGGMAPLCILAIPVTVVQPRFVNGGKARERSDRARGGCGRFFPNLGDCGRFFPNLCMKLAFFFCTLDTINRGSLCTGIDQFPTLFSFFSYNESFRETFSFFSFLFPFFRLLKKKKKILGGRPPPSPPWLRH